ncbi:MAG: CRTAC1 family protein, partial [Fuerstiella sp.]
LLLSRNDSEEMQTWDAGLPLNADTFPEVWFIRSQWCLASKDAPRAAFCLWRALSMAPNHAAANHQMAHALAILDRDNEATAFRERGLKLTRLATLANEVYLGDSRPAKLQEAVQLMESLGRLPEAIGWTVAAQYQNPQESWPLEAQQRLRQILNSNSAQKLADGPAAGLSFSTTAWLPPESNELPTDRTNNAQSTTQFTDATAAAGINFVYANAEDLSTNGRLMFEYTGGGVGALDFDLDGCCDLYFTQASALPPFQKQTTSFDVLYRNRQCQIFDDVSKLAGLLDFGFGQGVAAGDINNDGFPDLYVANIDGNRLYRNQGDGTFQEITDQANIGHPFWTTSVAIADLDLDSIPDLYDVTFLTGEDVFHRVCEEDGVARSCAPAGFEAANDFVYRGRGDGRFDEVSESIGITAADGDGLGILIADFAATGSPSIFIANDGRANFYFTRSPTDNEKVVFTEEGLSRGLAFDRDGRAQACMGIASSDFDGDGNWDLFVTNFFNESNTLYSQYPGESFGDNSQNAGIREASLGMLAFGVQAIDGDLDGWEDLLIGNGHVDDFSYKGIPYEMPPEYFRNEGNGHFKRLTADQLGETFQTPMLSRSMAVIDWNNDGLAEVAVSRLNDSAMLLENSSKDVGEYLTVRIVGTSSARDASTARVVATFDDRKVVRQFTAGDGYQASNQKQVIFGLGNAKNVEALQIVWPGGESQIFRNIASGQTVIIREGDTRIWQLPLKSAEQ